MPLERALLTKGSHHGTKLMVKPDQQEVVIPHKEAGDMLDDVYLRTCVSSGDIRDPLVVFNYQFIVTLNTVQEMNDNVPEILSKVREEGIISNQHYKELQTFANTQRTNLKAIEARPDYAETVEMPPEAAKHLGDHPDEFKESENPKP